MQLSVLNELSETLRICVSNFPYVAIRLAELDDLGNLITFIGRHPCAFDWIVTLNTYAWTVFRRV